MNKVLVSIIIPSYNEEKNIGKVIKDCRKLKKNFPLEIIIADGGSEDKTVENAKKYKADKVIVFPPKRGKGVDFWEGGLASRGKYIVQIDADYQFMPAEIPLFVEALKKGADVAVGTRFAGGKVQKGSISRRNLLGNSILSFITSVFCGRRITDVMAGFKAFRRSAFLALDLKEKHFEYEAEAVVKAVCMRMNLVEIPITYKKRYKGMSNIRALRDGLNVLKAIFAARLSTLTKNE